MGADSHLLSRAKGPRLTQDLHVAYVMVRLRWSGAVDSVAWIDCGHWAVGSSDRLERRVSPWRLREELRRRMAELEGGQGSSLANMSRDRMASKARVSPWAGR